jgi:hypothetical protein
LLKRDLCYLLDNLAKWSIRPISNRFVFTRAAAPLSNPRITGLDDNQENQRIPDQGQARLAHTSDSLLESLQARFVPAAQISPRAEANL